MVRSLKDKLRHGFNVSVAELDDAPVEPGDAGGGGDLGLDGLSDGQMKEVDDALHRLSVRWGRRFWILGGDAG